MVARQITERPVVIIPRVEYNTPEKVFSTIADTNEFIPLVSVNKGELFTMKDGTKKFLYGLPHASMDFSTTGRVSNFCNMLTIQNGHWYKFTYDRLDNGHYLGYTGTVVHFTNVPYQITPLMMMCVKKEHLFTFDKNNIDYNKLCLVINRKFIEDEGHFRLYRNVNKLYIEKINHLVDVHITNNMEGILFNSNLADVPKLKTFTEVQSFMNNMNSILIEQIKKQ